MLLHYTIYFPWSSTYVCKCIEKVTQQCGYNDIKLERKWNNTHTVDTKGLASSIMFSFFIKTGIYFACEVKTNFATVIRKKGSMYKKRSQMWTSLLLLEGDNLYPGLYMHGKTLQEHMRNSKAGYTGLISHFISFCTVPFFGSFTKSILFHVKQNISLKKRNLSKLTTKIQ